MPVIETWLKTDIRHAVAVQYLNGNLFSADNGANRIGAEVYDGETPVVLSGGVNGYVIRSDNVTIPVTGELSGNRASIVLPSSCYSVVGPISIVIKVGTTTVGACASHVYRTTTDSIIDPGHVIPSIEELLAQIEACRNATTAATAAAAAANTAATNADTKAGLANTAAENANTKAGQANTAATNANTAANAINNMTATATGLAAGASPTVQVSDVSGHKNLAFGIPKGDTGATPDFSIGTVSTLNPDQSATASITGTAENPVLNLGIPRGQTGSVTNVYGTTIPVSESDNRSVTQVLNTKLDSVPNMTGATSSTAGAAGLVPAPAAGDQAKVLKGDGTWGTIVTDPMTGATASTNGTVGLVPAPQAGDQAKVLTGAGTWNAIPEMTGATALTAGSVGLVPAPASGDQDKVLTGAGTWSEVAGQELLGYKETGDTASQTIADGSFVIWKGDLYKANGAIPQGTAFSSSNLTAVTSGGFNDLQSSVDSLSDSIAWKHHNKTQGTTISIPSNATEYKVIVSYGTSSGEQALSYAFDFLNDSGYNNKTLTQGYALPNGSGFCQLSVNISSHQLALTGFYINGTDYKDTSYINVFYR